ncbi:plant self-incompatibility protein S1 family [Striga asiatica]|uniref:S-protein homolog n=1 Tax=Striga asiatica TaxID=4170 RepID=A0A5A7R220_STRAF|nr:plant self-incompatibility protein S1 family [Striga asiatica]
MIKYLILLSFLISAQDLFHKTDGCLINKLFKVRVTLVNTIPVDSVSMHCWSKDDDLGNRELASNQSWGFSFCLKPFSTLFACHLHWGRAQVAFDVYDAKWVLLPCEDDNHCTWTIDESGVSPARDLFHKADGCLINKLFKVRVTLVNTIPVNPPVSMHCWSKDDDLGHHKLASNQSWGFGFCLKPFSTLFACHLHWGRAHAAFDVYDAKWVILPCEDDNHCTWKIDEYGVWPARVPNIFMLGNTKLASRNLIKLVCA